MKADLTRSTFHPLKHFTRVLMQQGRVQLDSDWNEQAAILLHYLQTLGADLIGDAGGVDGNAFLITPIDSAPNDFQIGLGRYYVDGIPCEAVAEAVPITANADTNDFTVPQWTLDGKALAQDQLVEIFDDVAQPFAKPGIPKPIVTTINKATQSGRKLTFTPAVDLKNAINPSMRRVITYLTQPDLPSPDQLSQTSGNSAGYLAYLDVWERHITWIEDNSIQEVALGGPDTATRAKIVWQVKAIKGEINEENKDKPCDGFTPDDDTFMATLFGPNHGRLKARAQQKSIPVDPCIIPPDANYYGEENQLYRVEVHKGGPASSNRDITVTYQPGIKRRAGQGQSDGATFKWSRENGSVTFPIVGPISTGDNVTTLTLANLGRDDRFSLAQGDWVEIQDDDYVLRNQASPLLQVQSVDHSRLQVTLAGTPDPKVGTVPAKHPLLRRWDQKQGDPAEGGLALGADNAALIQETDGNMWLELENGVQIQFQPAPAEKQNVYRTGDYWLIPARTATADVEWPNETVTDNQGNSSVNPLSKPPDGIEHHYAPLCAFTVTSGKLTLLGESPTDASSTCRKIFNPLDNV